MRCAVFHCDNNNNKNSQKKWSFHHFPTDEDLISKWLKFCRRGDAVNSKNAVICSAHFNPDDFERNMQFEMGFCKKYAAKLKPGSVPTIHPEGDTATSTTRQSNFQPASLKRKLFAPVDSNEDSKKENDNKKVSVNPWKQKYLEAQNQVSEMNSQIKTLQGKVKSLRSENLSLSKKLSKIKFQNNSIEEKLKCMFTEGQIKKLKNGGKKQIWTEEDIAQSKTLYSASAKTYKMLRRKNFPLPSVRTLQRWKNVDIFTGILEPFVKVLIEIDDTITM